MVMTAVATLVVWTLSVERTTRAIDDLGQGFREEQARLLGMQIADVLRPAWTEARRYAETLREHPETRSTLADLDLVESNLASVE